MCLRQTGLLDVGMITWIIRHHATSITNIFGLISEFTLQIHCFHHKATFSGSRIEPSLLQRWLNVQAIEDKPMGDEQSWSSLRPCNHPRSRPKIQNPKGRHKAMTRYTMKKWRKSQPSKKKQLDLAEKKYQSNTYRIHVTQPLK